MKNSLSEQLSRVDNLLVINSELDRALKSNKEDTSTVLSELGEIYTELSLAQEDIKKLEKAIVAYKSQQSRSWIGALLLAGGVGTGTGLTVNGVYQHNPEQIVAGTSTAALASLAWLIGHYTFKLF